MTRIHSNAVAAVLALACGVVHATPPATTAGTPVAPGPIPDVPAEVHTVVSGGCWHRGASQGAFRLLVAEAGFEQVFHRAFLQLIESDLERGLVKVAHTARIDEVDGTSLALLHDVRFVQDGNRCETGAFEGTIDRRTPERDVGKSRFRLRPRPDGGYTWTESPLNR